MTEEHLQTAIDNAYLLMYKRMDWEEEQLEASRPAEAADAIEEEVEPSMPAEAAQAMEEEQQEEEEATEDREDQAEDTGREEQEAHFRTLEDEKVTILNIPLAEVKRYRWLAKQIKQIRPLENQLCSSFVRSSHRISRPKNPYKADVLPGIRADLLPGG